MVSFILGLRIRRPDSVRIIMEYAAENLKLGMRDSDVVDTYMAIRKDLGLKPQMPIESLKSDVPDMFDNFGIDRIPHIIAGTNCSEPHELFINMRWFVKDFSDCNGNLITSDDPVYQEYGLGDKRCVIGIPLSPSKALFATHPDGFWGLVSKCSAGMMDKLNYTVVAQAHSWVIDVSDQHKNFVQKNFGIKRKSIRIF